jgi:hypothetical protein
MQDIKRILPFLLERLDDQCLAFFVGAGIPASEAGLPSGQSLKQGLLEKLGDPDDDRGLAEVASQYENERDRISLFDFLAKSLVFRGDIQQAKVCPSYKMLLDMPARSFITTNFDALFELVAEAKNVPLQVFRTDGQMASYKPTGLSLLKIHGDLSVAPDQITVTLEDYSSYFSRCPLFTHRIKDALQNTIVFLGYSLTDPDFIYLYTSVLDALGGLKRKSYAVLASDPGVKIREAWAQKKIEIIISTGQDFVHQLLAAYEERVASSRQQKGPVRLTTDRKVALPKFSSTARPNRARKAFAYFVARQKALLKAEAYAFCTIDTLQTSAELLNPARKITQLLSAKVQEISTKLGEKGFYPEVLPLLDQVPEKTRQRMIQETDFCIVFVSTTAYGVYLNRFYGPVASTKPILVFVHNNLRARLSEDLVFRGLLQVGAELTVFKSRDISSCALRGMLERLLETKSDEWLARTLKI